MLRSIFNRDSWLWVLAFIGAILAYLSQAAPPTEWTYQQWIQFGAVIVAYLLGKMGTSPLAGKPKNGNTVSASTLLKLLIPLTLAPFMLACGPLNIQTNPVGATAHYATQVIRATQGVQQAVIAAEEMKTISTDKTAEVVKTTVQIGKKGQELADALTELDKLDLDDFGRKPIVAKVGLILQTTNELVDKLKLADYFVTLSEQTKAEIYKLLKEIGNVLLTLSLEVR